MQRARELAARHLRHDLVGEREVEALRVGAKRRQGGSAVLEAYRLIAKDGQHLLPERDQLGFVINQQDGLAMTPGSGGIAALLLAGGLLLRLRKVSLEGAPHAALADHVE